MRLIGRRSGGSAHRSTSAAPSLPGIVIVPLSGCSNPAMLRSRVVFPHPEGPSSAKNSFCRMSRLTSSTAIVVAESLGQAPDRQQGRSGLGHRSSVSLVMRWAAITMVKLTSSSKAARALISGVTPKRTME